MKNEVRQPKQERSIEKKHKIINAGYELFSEVGYYGTNTAEIAKRAGVSTGIVYGYFQDKRDILISVLDIYIDNAFTPVLKMFDNLKAPINYDVLVPKIVDEVIKTHKRNRKIHEALHAMASTDKLVNAQFIELEDKITERFSEKLTTLDNNLESPNERVHFAMDIVQSFCHEYIYDKHDYIDYTFMRSLVEKTIISLFTK